MAARNGSVDCVLALLRAGADANALSNNFRGPWLAAASRGHVGVLALLLEAGARVMLPDKGGLTIAHEAAAAGQIKALRWMGSVASTGIRNSGPECYPAKASDLCQSKSMSLPTASSDEAAEAHSPPAMLSASSPSSLMLISQLSARDVLGRTPLHSAAVEGQTAVVSWMLSLASEMA